MNKQTSNELRLQRLGGWAALFEATAYIIGFVVMIFFLTPEEGTDPLSFLVENKTFYQLWMLVIYVFFGIALVPLVTALYEHLGRNDYLEVRFGTLFGYIWVGLVIASGMVAHQGLESVARIMPYDVQQAEAVWAALEAVQNGLGGGVEVVGGLWVLLVSIVALRQNVLQKAANYLGLVVGLAGILTIIPGLGELGAVFGLLQILWFIAIARVLLKS